MSMSGRPFGSREATDVPSTRHLTDWGRGDDQQSMFTQAYNDRHRRPHEAATGARLRAMSGADMGAALHHDDAPPREASCLGSSETPRPLATPWASEETVPVPAPHSPIRRRPSRMISHLGEAMQVNEGEAGITHPFVSSHTGPGQATGGGSFGGGGGGNGGGGGGSGGGGGGNGGNGGGGGGNGCGNGGGGRAATAVDELSETLGRLSVALAERAVGGIPAAQALEGHLRRYDPQGTGTISAADLMRLLKSTSCLAAPPSLLRELPPHMVRVRVRVRVRVGVGVRVRVRVRVRLPWLGLGLGLG